jgi:tetratricopeptide (TPR) repeat protein
VAPRRAPAPIDLAVVVGALLLLALPVLARVAADAQPVAPRPAALPPLPAQPRTAALRDLPVGLGPGTAPQRLADVRAAAVALLGERGAQRLLAEIDAPDFRFAADRRAYPYRYPGLDSVLAALPARLSVAQVVAATDLGARLTLLRRGAAAFAVLDRARAGGDCAPQLDLLLLVASDANARDAIVAREGARALRACPGDATAGWLLGQFQSLRGSGLAPFRALERSYPGSAAGWSGEGDAYLRSVYDVTGAFVARHIYEKALLRYRRAARLRPGPEIDAGIARALAGAGRPAEAAAVQARVVAALPPSASLQAALVLYLEAAHRFAAAARAARRLSGMGADVPRGTALYPAPVIEGPIADDDAAGALSLGAGRLAPLAVNLEGQLVLPAVVVTDVSFIPAFRPQPGVTGSDRWCPDWARTRDLILAGRPREALAGLPRRFEPLPGHPESCTDGAAAPLRAIAGNSAAAADARQNLWRWAGDLPRAERAARDWTSSAPSSALAWLRLGEIEFLRRHWSAVRRRARRRRR